MVGSTVLLSVSGAGLAFSVSGFCAFVAVTGSSLLVVVTVSAGFSGVDREGASVAASTEPFSWLPIAVSLSRLELSTLCGICAIEAGCSSESALQAVMLSRTAEEMKSPGMLILIGTSVSLTTGRRYLDHF